MGGKDKIVGSILCLPLLVEKCPFSRAIKQQSKALPADPLVSLSVHVEMLIHIRDQQKLLICLKLTPGKRHSLLVPLLNHRAVCPPCLCCQRAGSPHVCVVGNQWKTVSISVEIQRSFVYVLHVTRQMGK